MSSLTLTRPMDISKQPIQAISPISRIPNELLAEIFLFYAANYQVEWRHTVPGYWRNKETGECKGDDMAWIAVSHVSQRWRETALACPELWSKPTFSHLQWTPVMLQRSGAVPLDLQVQLHSGNYRALSSALGHASHKIGHLDIIIDTDAARLLDTVPVEAVATLPSLKSLKIAMMPVDNYKRNPFIADFSSVQVLSFDGCRLTWLQPHCSNLSHLTLKHRWVQYTPRGQNISHADFMGHLSHMTSLRELTIEDAFPDVSLIPISTPLVKLPHLRRLTLAGRRVDCTDIMSSISYGCSTIIKCTLHSEDANLSRYLSHRDCSVEEFFAAFSKHLNTDFCIRKLSMAGPRLSSTGDAADFRMWAYEELDNVALLDLYVDVFPGTQLPNYLKFWSALASKSVQSIHVSNSWSYSMDREIWRSFLLPLHNLKELTISLNPPSALLYALARSSDDSHIPLLLPNLRYIKLDSVPCSYGVLNTELPLSKGRFSKVLVHCLQSRKMEITPSVQKIDLHLTECSALWEFDLFHLANVANLKHDSTTRIVNDDLLFTSHERSPWLWLPHERDAGNISSRPV